MFVAGVYQQGVRNREIWWLPALGTWSCMRPELCEKFMTQFEGCTILN
jgi:hypothetical protein